MIMIENSQSGRRSVGAATCYTDERPDMILMDSNAFGGSVFNQQGTTERRKQSLRKMSLMLNIMALFDRGLMGRNECSGLYGLVLLHCQFSSWFYPEASQPLTLITNNTPLDDVVPVLGCLGPT